MLSRKPQESSYSYISFGDFTIFQPTSTPGENDVFEITRNVGGECFCYLPPYVTKGSEVRFDDKPWIPLIPQTPYFIRFEKVTLRLRSPLNFNFDISSRVAYSDIIKCVVFENKNDYFDMFSTQDSFTLGVEISGGTSSFWLREFYSKSFTIWAHPLYGGDYCYGVYPDNSTLRDSILSTNPYFNFCLGMSIAQFNLYPNQFTQRLNYLSFSNSYDSYRIETVYSSIPSNEKILFNFNFSNNQQQEGNRYSFISNYSLTANQNVSYTYSIPFRESLYIVARDKNAVQWQSLGFSFINYIGNTFSLYSSSNNFLFTTAVHNFFGANTMRIAILSNASSPQEVFIIILGR